MKKIAALFLSLALLFTIVTSVHAESKSVSVVIEGEQLQLGNQSIINEKGTTLVPADQILKKLDFVVSLDAEGQIITATKEELVISMQVGKQTAVVNEMELPLPTVPRLVDKTIYVPLRFISEVAGYEVTWNGEQRTVSIKIKVPSQGFMWKAENEGSTVYLLGSIHIADTAMYPLRKEIQKAYEASDFLVVEADITKANEPKMQELYLKLSSYEDGSTLKDHLSTETYKKLNTILVENGWQAGAFDAFKPWSISSTLDYLKAAKSGYDAGIGIDMFFLSQAIKQKLPILELESIEFQLNMLDNFSAELQDEMLAGAVESYYAEESGIDELTEMWKTGDEKMLLDVTLEAKDQAELNKAMLTDRNLTMADKIDGYLKKKDGSTYFVVVGAAHMLGEEGIVALLEKKGYKIDRQ